MPTSSNSSVWKRIGNKICHYKSYDDSNIDDKEQVRDLGIMMSNTSTFTLHSRNIVKKATDKMRWVLSVSVGEALSHTDTIEIPLHSPTRVLLPALESMESKSHTSYQTNSTNVCIQNYWERLHELKLYSLQRSRERNIITYIFGRSHSIWCQILMVQWDTK